MPDDLICEISFSKGNPVQPAVGSTPPGYRSNSGPQIPSTGGGAGTRLLGREEVSVHM